MYQIPAVSPGDEPIPHPKVKKLQPKAHRHSQVGLPPRVFLYTLDQIATILNLKVETLKSGYIYFEGRSTYAKKKGQMSARNIAPDDQVPVWRVIDTELIRWMKYKGYRYYESGVFYESERHNED